MFNPAKPQLRRGLVGHWRYNGSLAATGTWLDLSGNGNNGTLTGNVTVGSGGALIDGQSGNYVACGSDASLVSLTTYTLAAWVNVTSISGTGRLMFASSASGSERYNYFMQIPSALTIQAGFMDSDEVDHSVTTSATISTSTWTHLVSTFDGTYVRIYINGALSVTSSNFSAYTPDTALVPFEIGRLGFSGVYYYGFNGKADDARVYNRALPIEEIAYLYHLTKGFYN